MQYLGTVRLAKRRFEFSGAGRLRPNVLGLPKVWARRESQSYYPRDDPSYTWDQSDYTASVYFPMSALQSAHRAQRLDDCGLHLSQRLASRKQKSMKKKTAGLGPVVSGQKHHGFDRKCAIVQRHLESTPCLFPGAGIGGQNEQSLAPCRCWAATMFHVTRSNMSVLPISSSLGLAMNSHSTPLGSGGSGTLSVPKYHSAVKLKES